jgi:hypothetical protein
LVSSLSGAQALLFNYMPFGIAAELLGADGAHVGTPTAYTTDGEVLQYVRD